MDPQAHSRLQYLPQLLPPLTSIFPVTHRGRSRPYQCQGTLVPDGNRLLRLPVAGFLYETSLNFTFKRKAYEDRINESFSLLPALTVHAYAYQYFVLFLPATS